MYTPSTGRFLTRDTWGGDANVPLSFNRWNYGQSNPANHLDPSGQCSYSPTKNIEYVEKIVKLPKWDWLNTYTAAGIAVQCWATIYDLRANDEYDGLGPGKITPIQIVTPYGERIPNPEYPDDKTKNRGYGLLCYIVSKLDRNVGKAMSCTVCKTATEMDEIYGVGNYRQELPHDQTETKWAVEYMRRRIKLVTDTCVSHGCSSTDIYIAAALAQNGPGFTLYNLTEWLAECVNEMRQLV